MAFHIMGGAEEDEARDAEIDTAVAAERERCAKIAEGAAGGWNNTPSGRSVASRIAAAIRSEYWVSQRDTSTKDVFSVRRQPTACPVCALVFKGSQGLKVHMTFAHDR